MKLLWTAAALCLLIILLSGLTHGLYKLAEGMTIVVGIVFFVVLAVVWASRRDAPPQ